MRNAEFFVGRRGRRPPYELRRKNTAPVGNAVLSVPKLITKICDDFGTMWASPPTKCRRKLTAALASFGKGGGFCEAKDGGLEIKNNHFFGGLWSRNI